MSPLQRKAVLALLAGMVHGCGPSPGEGGAADAAVVADAAAADLRSAADLATDGPMPASEACTAYCERIARTCAGREQYDSNATCLAYCRFMAEGSTSTPNTLACRMEALAQFTLARPTTSCLAAGPGGDNGHLHSCGTACATFCGMALRICPTVFADAAGCMDACAAFPPLPPYAVPNVDRNNFGCRLYYLTQAARQPELHCAKIGPGGAVCR